MKHPEFRVWMARSGRFQAFPFVMPGLTRHPASLPHESHHEARSRIRVRGVTVNYQSASGRFQPREYSSLMMRAQSATTVSKKHPISSTERNPTCPIPRPPAYLRTAL